MKLMIGLHQSYTTGSDSYYIIYRLYTGTSERDIKQEILSDISYEFGSYGLGDQISKVNLNTDFRDLAKEVYDIVTLSPGYASSWGSIAEYELEIVPCQSINDVFNFYETFLENCEDLGDDEGADKQIAFDFNGDLGDEIRDVVEYGTPIGDYLMFLKRNYHIRIDWEFINRIKKLTR